MRRRLSSELIFVGQIDMKWKALTRVYTVLRLLSLVSLLAYLHLNSLMFIPLPAGPHYTAKCLPIFALFFSIPFFFMLLKGAGARKQTR